MSTSELIVRAPPMDDFVAFPGRGSDRAVERSGDSVESASAKQREHSRPECSGSVSVNTPQHHRISSTWTNPLENHRLTPEVGSLAFPTPAIKWGSFLHISLPKHAAQTCDAHKPGMLTLEICHPAARRAHHYSPGSLRQTQNSSGSIPRAEADQMSKRGPSDSNRTHIWRSFHNGTENERSSLGNDILTCLDKRWEYSNEPQKPRL